MQNLSGLSENELIILSIVHRIRGKRKGIPSHEIYDVFRKIKEDISLSTLEVLLKRMWFAGVLDLKYRKKEGFEVIWVYKTIADEDFEKLAQSDERLKKILELLEKATEEFTT